MKIRANHTRMWVRRQSVVRLSSAPRLGVRRSPEGAAMRHLLRGPERSGTNDPGVVQVHADHAVAGRVQLAPAPPRTVPAKVPGLTAPQTTRFFSDLNAALKSVLGVTARIRLADFSILGGPEFAAVIKRDPGLSSRYTTAQRETNRMCAARTKEAQRAAGYTDQDVREIEGYQRNSKYCTGTRATDELIAWYLTVKGFTPPGSGPSVVSAAQFQNNMLDTIVHEAVHRSEGAIWKQRCRPGFYRSRTHGVIAYIGQTLDEGATQIITELVIGELKKVPGRSWFSGYTSTAYADEAKKVRNILVNHGKNEDFLTRAYTAATNVTDVEDLQLWQ